MKINIFKGLLACGVLLSMSACEENTWNKDSLDGFEVPDMNGGGSSQVIQYTLTSSDYSSIAKNSDNIALATETGKLEALTAVGTRGYFNEEIQPREYVLPWLNAVQSNIKYPFYMLSNKATIQVYYKVAENQPEELLNIESAPAYNVTEANYQQAYGSDENYAMSFAPSYAPEKFIPGFLAAAYPDAKANDFVYVGYNYSNQDPVFGGEPAPVEVELLNADFKANNTPMTIVDETPLPEGVSYVWTQSSSYGWKASGYVSGKRYDLNSVLSTPEISLEGITDPKMEIGQIVNYLTDPQSMLSIEVVCDGAIEVLEGLTWPDGKSWTLASTGEISLEKYSGKTIKVQFRYTSNTSTAATWEVEWMTIKGMKGASRAASRAMANVPSSAENAVYKYDGSKWTKPDNIVVVQQSDYEAMGLNNLNATKAAEMLPKFLAGKFPYAASGDEKYVVYKYYDTTDKITYNQHCDRMTFDGTTWVMDTQETKMAQFVKTNGKWVYDPTIYLNFPASKTDASSLAFYNACVTWVWNNINLKVEGITDQTLADWPQTGKVATFGWCWGSNEPTQEGYGGASAYYCNYDNRITTLKSYLGEDFYNEHYGSYDEEEVLALTQKRFCEEVAKGALEALYPDAMPGTGFDQYYQIELVQYSPKQNVDIRYLVTEKGKFKFVDCPVWELKAE